MPRDGRFYVEYLGWKEARGLYGSNYTDPITVKLLNRRKSSRELHRMTIKVTRDELQITQHVTSPSGKSQKIKYPAMQICDVSYVSQCSPPNTDVVGCIFLGYNSQTHCAAHVHAYIFDSADTATVFVKLVNSIIEQADYRERVIAMEHDLFEHGHISERSDHRQISSHDTIGSDGASFGSVSPNSSESGLPRTYPTAEQALRARTDIVIKRTSSQKKSGASKLFDNVQDELSHKLTMQQEKEMPILLPPKDYDTIVRRYGHLSIRGKVKQRTIIGAESVFANPTANGKKNHTTAKQHKVDGYTLQKSPSSGSADDQDVADGASSQSSTDEDPSVYGLYKGLKTKNGHSEALEHMAMWSPQFSFNTQSSSGSSGFGSSQTGLRRMKVTASK